MRHQVKRNQFTKRDALVKALLTSFFRNGYSETTFAKAKLLQQEAESLITFTRRKLEKEEEFNAIREIKRCVGSVESSKNLIEFAKKTKKKSGFTRFVKTRYRQGDGSLMAIVEIIHE